MNREELVKLIKQKKSLLCVGLDTDPDRVPAHLQHHADPVFEFNRQIIEATLPFAVAYKPNMAFYEARGAAGWQSLQATMQYLNGKAFTIADAKRGDIGNTAGMYAKAFFEQMSFDAITLSPYMGKDSVTPFLKYPDKWAIVLGLTSNPGSADLQTVEGGAGPLYQRVLKKAPEWGSTANLMFVVGATKSALFRQVRQLVPDHFLLVPGVGAQGGNLQEVCEAGINPDGGLLINSSRGILYAGDGKNFAEKAAEAASALQREMAGYLQQAGVV